MHLVINKRLAQVAKSVTSTASFLLVGTVSRVYLGFLAAVLLSNGPKSIFLKEIFAILEFQSH